MAPWPSEGFPAQRFEVLPAPNHFVDIPHLERQMIEASTGHPRIHEKHVVVIAGRRATHKQPAIGVAVGHDEAQTLNVKPCRHAGIIHADGDVADLARGGHFVDGRPAINPLRLARCVVTRGLEGGGFAAGNPKGQVDPQIINAVQHALGVQLSASITAQFVGQCGERCLVFNAPDNLAQATATSDGRALNARRIGGHDFDLRAVGCAKQLHLRVG